MQSKAVNNQAVPDIESVHQKYAKPTNFSRYASKDHKSATHMVGYCLTLIDLPSMWQLATVLHARLEPRERAFLAIAVLWSLTDEEYADVIEYMSEGEA